MDQDFSRAKHLTELRDRLIRRLRELEKKQATLGYSADPSIELEMQEIRDRLENITLESSHHISASIQKGNTKQKSIIIISVTAIIATALFLLLLYRSGNTLIGTIGNSGTIIQSGGDVLLQSSETDVPVENAIRLDAGYGLWTCGLFVKNFDLQKGMDYYYKQIMNGQPDRMLINYQYPVINLDVVAQGKDEEIKLAPYAVIENLEIKPISDSEQYARDVNTGCGVGSTPEMFMTVLSPKQRKYFGAPHVGAYDPGSQDVSKLEKDKQSFGYFKLKKGEKDSFVVYIHHEPGYVYRFRVGVIYTYKGGQYTKWIDQEFVVISPDKARNIDNGVDQGISTINAWEGLEQLRQENNEKVVRFSAFKLPRE